MSRVATLSALALLALVVPAAYPEGAPPRPPARQSLDDAWWTGPLLANTAATASRGHRLIETYVYDLRAVGRFDRDGARQSAAAASHYGTQTYLVFGVADGLAIGFIPAFGYDTAHAAPSSSGIGVGDSTAMAQIRITDFDAERSIPAIAFNVQQTFPTGRYDRLGDRANDGQGGGAAVTTLSLYSQMYTWMPNGRILRLRFDASRSLSSTARVRDASVYGTAEGFRGRAEPGGATALDASLEYSLTRSWVLATDFFVRWSGDTRVVGTLADGGPLTVRHSGPSTQVGLAPAMEYSWTPNLGVIGGVRWVAGGKNTTATLAPVVAINYFR
jgi:hypothetical protein